MRRGRHLTAPDLPSEDVEIHVTQSASKLSAHSQVLSLFSHMFAGLPRSPSDSNVVWDLSNLRIDEAPVGSVVVQLWLDAVYAQVDSARQLCLPPGFTMSDARPLLLFAEAVGTVDVVMQAVGRAVVDITELAITVKLPELPEKHIQLKARGAIYYISRLSKLHEVADGQYRVILDAGTLAQGRSGLLRNIATTLEEHFHLAARLHIVPLTRLLLDFFKAQCAPAPGDVVLPFVDLVLSPRVMQLIPQELLLEAFVRDALLIRPSHVRLRPTDKSVEYILESEIASNWFSQPVGDIVGVAPVGGADGRSFISGLACTTILGGPTMENCATIVQRIVRKTQEDVDSAGGSDWANG